MLSRYNSAIFNRSTNLTPPVEPSYNINKYRNRLFWRKFKFLLLLGENSHFYIFKFAISLTVSEITADLKKKNFNRRVNLIVPVEASLKSIFIKYLKKLKFLLLTGEMVKNVY